MRWIPNAYKLVTGPTSEPITTSDAKLDRRITGSDDDAAVVRWIASARSRAESYLGRGLLQQTWKLALDEFVDEIELPMAAPLQSVTSVQYYNTSGSLTTLGASVYQVDTLSEPGRVLLAPDQVWPATQSGRRLAVEITYVVGYANAAAIPPDVLDALYLWIGDRDQFRESLSESVVTSIPAGVEALLAPHRVFWRAPRAA